MSYTTTQLITNAWYLSGIVARNLQTVTGDQISDGLSLLNNSVIAVKSANMRLIPYFTEYNGQFIQGQEQYFIPNLITVETMTFFIDTGNQVRYPMMPQKRIMYWASGRINGIQSLPFAYDVQRVFNGCNVFVYFVPQANYNFQIWGKFQLSSVTLTQDLSLTLDAFYIEYLRYALAEQMCTEYNIAMQPQNLKRLQEMESIILTVSPPDLSLQKMSYLVKESKLSYAQVNIGRGWTL